jgi:predicted esterase YcpF (UPF0227 family)
MERRDNNPLKLLLFICFWQARFSHKMGLRCVIVNPLLFHFEQEKRRVERNADNGAWRYIIAREALNKSSLARRRLCGMGCAKGDDANGQSPSLVA